MKDLKSIYLQLFASDRNEWHNDASFSIFEVLKLRLDLLILKVYVLRLNILKLSIKVTKVSILVRWEGRYNITKSYSIEKHVS